MRWIRNHALKVLPLILLFVQPGKVSAQIQAYIDLADGLVAHWKFDEIKENGVVLDSSGNDIHGFVEGAVTVSGQVDGALRFDGFDDVVYIARKEDEIPDEISKLEYGTIALWFRFDMFNQPIIPMLYYGESEVFGPHDSLVIEIGHNFTDRNRKVYYTVFATKLCFDTNIDLYDDEWYHFAVVVGPDGNTGYLNGLELVDRHYNLGSDEFFSEFFAPVYNRDIFTIGYGRYGQRDNFDFYKGDLDDIRIYDRPLSDDEIWELYAGTVTAIESFGTPDTFVLYDNHPNPFNPNTVISFSLPSDAIVDLDIYNSAGQRIRRLLSSPLKSGIHSYRWDGINDNGRTASAGVYFSVLSDGTHREVNKMLLLK